MTNTITIDFEPLIKSLRDLKEAVSKLTPRVLADLKEDMKLPKPKKLGDYSRKINYETAKIIREYLKLGHSNVVLGKKFGISPHTVSQIKHRHIWK